MIKKFFIKIFLRKVNIDDDISLKVKEEIKAIVSKKDLFKSNSNFLWMVIDYNLRKKTNTVVQLEALKRILKNG